MGSGVLDSSIAVWIWLLALALMHVFILGRWLMLAHPPTHKLPGESLTLFSTMVIASMVQRYERFTAKRYRRQLCVYLLSWFSVGLLLILSNSLGWLLVAAEVVYAGLRRRAHPDLTRSMIAAAVLIGAIYMLAIAMRA